MSIVHKSTSIYLSELIYDCFSKLGPGHFITTATVTGNYNNNKKT